MQKIFTNQISKKILCSLAVILAFQSSALALEENTSQSKDNIANLSDNDIANLSLEDLLNIEIVSASQQAEPLREAPVPVTVITSEMIENIGAKNLKDVLVTYVPGMTFVQDHNEIFTAMRGVYASAQQKILILVDGHRINGRVGSIADMDYSISLEKIKQVEVLRGPASSLYGNVALTAVINIITKTGKEANGTTITGGIGNYGQKKLSLIHGYSSGDNNDLFMWGTIYQADGQKFAISKENDYSDKPQSGFAIVEGVKDKPSYDIGLKYKFGDFSIFANSHFTKYIEPFSAGGSTGRVYNYDDYRTFFGNGPGQANLFHHLDFSYQKTFLDDFNLSVNTYTDYNEVSPHQILDPSIKSHGYINWQDFDLGLIAQVSKPYSLSNLGIGDGNVLFGLQVETMSLIDSSFPTGTNGEWEKFNDTKAKILTEKGTENVYSGFAQVKHKFMDSLILNAGLRYDEKQRKEGANVRDISPRLAVIYLPTDMFEMKLSYAQSFVDAPYFYRYNSLPSYTGSKDLRPEHLRSVQFTPTVRFLDGHLVSTTNIFYNDLYDFIYRDPKAPKEGPNYKNAGSLKSVGLEEEVSFIQDFYSLRGNLAYQRAVSAKDYPVTGSEIYNIPSLTGNLIFDINPIYWLYKNFSVNLTTRYIGSQLSPILNNFKGGVAINEPNNRVGQALLFNAGFRVTEPWLNKVSLDARVYNIFDTYYEQGGSVAHPYPQAGRWFLVNLSYSF